MILRTYACSVCNHTMEVELRSDQWDTPPPDCPWCCVQPMAQEFQPPAIGGSDRARATDMAHKIAVEDYKIADIQTGGGEGSVPKVRYSDSSQPASTWTAARGALETAVALGRESRLKYGNGLEVLQTSLKNGTQRDLIADSKRRSAKIW
jgi:hypothetical protein